MEDEVYRAEAEEIPKRMVWEARFKLARSYDNSPEAKLGFGQVLRLSDTMFLRQVEASHCWMRFLVCCLNFEID